MGCDDCRYYNYKLLSCAIVVFCFFVQAEDGIRDFCLSRGLGSDLYAQDAELAQELLRHESIETTHESYRKQNVAERRERLERALDE